MPEEVLQSGGGCGGAEEAGGIRTPGPLDSDIADALPVEAWLIEDVALSASLRLSLRLTSWMSSKYRWPIVGREAGDRFLGALATLLVCWTTVRPPFQGGDCCHSHEGPPRRGRGGGGRWETPWSVPVWGLVDEIEKAVGGEAGLWEEGKDEEPRPGLRQRNRYRMHSTVCELSPICQVPKTRLGPSKPQATNELQPQLQYLAASPSLTVY